MAAILRVSREIFTIWLAEAVCVIGRPGPSVGRVQTNTEDTEGTGEA